MGNIYNFITYDEEIEFSIGGNDLLNYINDNISIEIQRGLDNFKHLCNSQKNFKEHSDYILILKLFKNDNYALSNYYKNKLIKILNNSNILNYSLKEISDYITKSFIREISSDLETLQSTLLTA